MRDLSGCYFLEGASARRPATGGLVLREVNSASMAASVRRSAGETTAHGVAHTTLSIRTFGGLEVRLGAEPLVLPPSRKTRALLAYLVLSATHQRRERLCELFWNIPDDPRAALRWSLSKLRPILNAGSCSRLVADRDRVQVTSEACTVDFHELRACANDDSASAAALSHAWELSNQLLVEDCELPDQPDFMAWLQHQRNESVRLRTQLSRRLALLPDLSAEDAEEWAQRWLHEAPGDARAAQQVLIAKRRLGRGQLAPALTSDLERTFCEAKVPPPDICESPAGVDDSASAVVTEGAGTAVPEQLMRFVQADDRTALAWASVGAASNPPLVKAANWLAHLGLDWEAPVWSPLFRELARTFRFIRYDERGCGLSDWDVPEISFEASVSDLEKVVDAAELECFPLLGIGQGASVSIEYAARHPERVSHLILVGGYAAGWRHTATPEESREREAIMVLMEAGWGRDNPCYRRLLSQSFMPDANSEELSWFDEFQRRTTSPQNAVRLLETASRVDVRHRLKDVKAPSLVLHSRGDAVVPVATGRELARRIENAELVGLESNNHLLLGREPAAADFLQAVRDFTTRA